MPGHLIEVVLSLCGIVILLLVVASIVASPILFFVLQARVRRLEQKLKQLERPEPELQIEPHGQQPIQTPAPAPLPPITPPLIAPPPLVAWPQAPRTPHDTPIPIEALAAPIPPAPIAPVPPVGTASPFAGGGSLEERFAGKWLAWIGAIALIVGAGFFFYYAVDRQWIGPNGRVVIGILVGMAGFAGGALAMLRKYRFLSQAVAGASMGILYVTLFAAFQLFPEPVLPQEVAFAGMILVTAGALAFAAYFNAQSTAILGLIGGFLTPIMLTTGVDAQWTLFTYILILDIGVLGVATFRKWQTLQILSFVATCVIWIGWFGRHYQPEKLGATLFLLTAYFVLFALLGIWYNVWNRQKARVADFFVILATPIAYFVALYDVTEANYAFLHGLLAVGLAGTYLALGLWALTRNPQGTLVIVGMGGLAAAFLTVAIPLQLTGHWIAIAWAGESLLLFELGLRFNEWKLRYAGFVLLGVVHLILLSFAVETMVDPAAFETRFTRAKVEATVPPTVDGPRYTDSGELQLATPQTVTPPDVPWTDVFNGRMFSFLASAVAMGIMAWEYRRKLAAMPTFAQASGESQAVPETHPFAIAGGVFLAAVPVSLLAMFLLETFSLGYLKEWTGSTHLGLYAVWTSAVAAGLFAMALWLRPRWLQFVGLGVMGLLALILLSIFIGTLSHTLDPLDYIDPKNPPLAMWYWFLANPRGLGFLAAVGAAAGAIVMAHRMAGEVKSAVATQRVIPMILGLFAYGATLAMFTVEVYSQGVLRDWGTWTNLAVTLTWTILAIVSLLSGIFAGSWLLRILSLALFLLTTLKVFLYDIWTLEATIRVLAFVALGVALLGVSFFYRFFRDRIRAWIAPAAVLLALMCGVANAYPPLYSEGVRGGSSAAVLPLAQYVSGPSAEAPASEEQPLVNRLQFQWPFEKLPAEASPLFRVKVPLELYGHARLDLGDVRVFRVTSGKPTEIPYVLRQPQDSLKVQERTIPPLNLSQKDGATEFLLDLGETIDPVNEILISISSSDKNYERPVKIFGANAHDAADWNLLTDKGFVLDFSRPQHRFTSGRVTFPPSRFKVYKVAIDNQGQPPLTVEGAKVFHREEVLAPREKYLADVASQTTNEERKQTTVILDLKHARLPTQGLELSIDYQGNYHRHVAVAVDDRNDSKSTWQEVVRGDIYRIERGELRAVSSNLSWPENRGRFVKLTIHNGDDPPLRVTGAKASGIARYLVLPASQLAAPPGELALYAASIKVTAPDYDLARTIGSFQLDTLPEVTLGRAQQNPHFREPTAPERIIPWSEQNKLLLWTATIVGVVVLGGLTFLLLRRAAVAAKAGGGEEE